MPTANNWKHREATTEAMDNISAVWRSKIQANTAALDEQLGSASVVPRGTSEEFVPREPTYNEQQMTHPEYSGDQQASAMYNPSAIGKLQKIAKQIPWWEATGMGAIKETQDLYQGAKQLFGIGDQDELAADIELRNEAFKAMGKYHPASMFAGGMAPYFAPMASSEALAVGVGTKLLPAVVKLPGQLYRWGHKAIKGGGIGKIPQTRKFVSNIEKKLKSPWVRQKLASPFISGAITGGGLGAIHPHDTAATGTITGGVGSLIGQRVGRLLGPTPNTLQPTQKIRADMAREQGFNLLPGAETGDPFLKYMDAKFRSRPEFVDKVQAFDSVNERIGTENALDLLAFKNQAGSQHISDTSHRRAPSVPANNEIGDITEAQKFWAAANKKADAFLNVQVEGSRVTAPESRQQGINEQSLSHAKTKVKNMWENLKQPTLLAPFLPKVAFDDYYGPTKLILREGGATATKREGVLSGFERAIEEQIKKHFAATGSRKDSFLSAQLELLEDAFGKIKKIPGGSEFYRDPIKKDWPNTVIEIRKNIKNRMLTQQGGSLPGQQAIVPRLEELMDGFDDVMEYGIKKVAKDNRTGKQIKAEYKELRQGEDYVGILEGAHNLATGGIDPKKLKSQLMRMSGRSTFLEGDTKIGDLAKAMDYLENEKRNVLKRGMRPPHSTYSLTDLGEWGKRLKAMAKLQTTPEDQIGAIKGSAAKMFLNPAVTSMPFGLGNISQHAYTAGWPHVSGVLPIPGLNATHTKAIGGAMTTSEGDPNVSADDALMETLRSMLPAQLAIAAGKAGVDTMPELWEFLKENVLQ